MAARRPPPRPTHRPFSPSRTLLSPSQTLPALPDGASGSLPPALYRLLDPAAPPALPPPAAAAALAPADNRELDKLVAALGRSKATWRRALLLHEWLLAGGHRGDDRLYTTLIRVAAQHGQAAAALALYDWMRAAPAAGGAGLRCTVYTYTAAMRAALAGGLLDRALEVWGHAEAGAPAEIDCRLCTALVEVLARRGEPDAALAAYARMRAAPADSKLAPTVHAYTAAMRAAAEGGRWEAALAVWDDMVAAGCKPTGHAYSAAISACAAGGRWRRAVALFDEMLAWGVRPDVVSCTALVAALGADGQWERAERVVAWMGANEVRPNVRTYTALVAALAAGRRFERAGEVIAAMRAGALGPGLEPNAYTYSALLKGLGDAGDWRGAEALFGELEAEALGAARAEAAMEAAVSAAAAAGAAAAAAEAAGGAARAGGESAEEADAAAALVASAVQCALGGESAAAADVSAAAAAAASDFFLSSAPADCASPAGASPRGPAFSYFSSASPPPSPGAPGLPARAAWTAENAAVRGLSLDLPSAAAAEEAAAAAASTSAAGAPARAGAAAGGAAAARARGALNEVVCGALMLAYERAGRWRECVAVLGRARALGLSPNTVMFNTALSALGKAGEARAAAALFAALPAPDAVSHETLVAAHGVAGDAAAAEAALAAMRAAGHAPRDYAWCGLVAAHSLAGDWRAALRVRERAAAEAAGAPGAGGAPAAPGVPSVHLFNALLAAADRARQYERAVSLWAEMRAAGVAPNAATRALLEGVARSGVRAVEGQQAAVAALTAAVAAAGTVMIRAGVF